MVCYLPTADGAPHYTLGMMTPFNGQLSTSEYTASGSSTALTPSPRTTCTRFRDVTVKQLVAIGRSMEVDRLRHIDQPHVVVPPEHVVRREVRVHPTRIDNGAQTVEELCPRYG